ncbi:MAG: hypothetical protein WBK37_07720, partial [Kiritimatiellia bacterium]
MALLALRRDRPAAHPANEKPEKRKAIAALLALGTAATLVDALHLLEKTVGHDGRVRAIVDFPLIFEHSYIKRIGQQRGHAVGADFFSVQAGQPPFLRQPAKVARAVAVGRVGLEQTAHQRRFRLVHNHGMRFGVVQIADGGAARILAPPQLLADAAPHIFREVFHIILRLAERDIEHELALRRVLKPESRKFQRFQVARGKQVHDSPAVHRISRQAVGMPRNDALRVAALDFLDHFIEDGPTRCLRGHRLDEFADDLNAVFLRQFAQFVQLAFNRKHLAVVLVGGLAGIEEEVHGLPPFLAFLAIVLDARTILPKAATSGGASFFNSRCSPSVTMNILEPALRFRNLHNRLGIVNCPREVMLAMSIIMAHLHLARNACEMKLHRGGGVVKCLFGDFLGRGSGVGAAESGPPRAPCEERTPSAGVDRFRRRGFRARSGRTAWASPSYARVRTARKQSRPRGGRVLGAAASPHAPTGPIRP